MSSFVFIDARVQDWGQLLAGLASDVQLVLLDPSQDGITQIANALAEITALDAIHIISHGSGGTLYLGSTVLTSENLSSYSSELATIGAALSGTGDILLYGCEVASGTEGQSFIKDLARYTGADVAASNDSTGSAALGGNWVLEANSGSIETDLVVGLGTQQAYTLTLDTITGTSGNDTNLSGTAGDDTISGLAGNDKLIGGAGNDLLDGGAGIDTAVYGGPSSGYSFSGTGSNFIVTDTDSSNGSDGVDTLIGMDKVSFPDGVISFTSEFRVNTTTIAYQEGVPAMTGLASGGFVVTWNSFFQDGSGSGIYAQRYDENGATQGAEFRVNTTTADDQSGSAVTALASGGFVVTWTSFLQDGSGSGIYAQRYDANGAALGAEFRVNATTANEQVDPAVTALAGGGFVVAWQSDAQDGSSYGIYAQRYDANGAAQGAEVRVNTTTANEQSGPAVTALAGGFVATWASLAQDGSSYGIYAQRYDANGAALGAQFRVNTTTVGSQYDSAVTALASGGFVVTWDSFQDGSYFDIYAQRYDANGAAQGAEFRVNTTTAGYQVDPTITALASGGFVVTWQSWWQDADIYAQRYDANGAAQGNEFRVNTTMANSQFESAVTALAGGGFVVTWQSQSQDGWGYSIYAQRYDAVGNIVGIVTQLTGDDGANTLTWEGANGIALAGGRGDDTLVGGSGNDRLTGDDGLDWADYSGAGSPVTVHLYHPYDGVGQNTGGAGIDTLRTIENLLGSNYNDALTGNSDDNQLDGGAGNDTLIGGIGDDLYFVDAAGDVVIEDDNFYQFDSVWSSVSHTLTANVEHLTLTGAGNSIGNGNELANRLTGNSGNNSLNGHGGYDALDGGLGSDTMSGGSGNDLYYVDAAGDIVMEDAAAGADSVQSSISYALAANVEHLTLTGSDNATADGNSLANQLTGNNGNNTLNGGGGDDTLDGGTGSDIMSGGGDNDLYFVNAAGDVVMEDAAAGTDTVQSNVTHTLAANVEHLTLTGTGNATVNGNSLANQLTGNSGNNTLNGGDGDDTLDGGIGSDTMSGGSDNDLYVVNAIGDVVIENSGAGTDLIQTSTSHTLGANVENLTLTGVGNSSGNGNGLDNLLTGNVKNNHLNGGTGNDTMTGGAGNDTYSVNVATDQVTESLTGGIDLIYAATSYALGANIEYLTLTGTGHSAGTGNSLDNTITGNNGNNRLIGNAGADTLTGGAGNDTLTGGTGIDTFDYNALADAGDTITGFVAGAGGDKLDIDTLMTVLGYNGANPLDTGGGAGYVQLVQAGAHTLVKIDSNGGGDNFATTLTTLQNVTAGNVTLADNFIV